MAAHPTRVVAAASPQAWRETPSYFLVPGAAARG